RAAERGACRREMPVTFSCPDGTVIEGVVDLAFEDEGRWTVVDFKTDIEIGQNGLQTYRRQVGFYGAAITRATSQPARGVLLRICPGQTATGSRRGSESRPSPRWQMDSRRPRCGRSCSRHL